VKLIIENWKKFLKEEVLEEAAVENIDDQGLLVFPSLDNPQYIILYNPTIAKPLLRGMDFDKIERIHNGVLELRFNQNIVHWRLSKFGQSQALDPRFIE